MQIPILQIRVPARYQCSRTLFYTVSIAGPGVIARIVAIGTALLARGEIVCRCRKCFLLRKINREIMGPGDNGAGD